LTPDSDIAILLLMNANEIDLTMHRLMLLVLRCKNTMDRTALTFGTLKRQDTADLQAAATRCIQAGLVSFGTSNASAKAWSRGASDCLLYLTKAGKAWLRAQGNDFGSGKLYQAQLEAARAARKAAEPKVTVTVAPVLFVQHAGRA
jgi:hypothetical protein